MDRPAAWIDVTAHDPRRSRAFDGDLLARAERLGGGVAARPWTVPGLRTMAVVLDPDDHRVGLWTPPSDEHHGRAPAIRRGRRR